MKFSPDLREKIILRFTFYVKDLMLFLTDTFRKTALLSKYIYKHKTCR